MNGRPVDVSVLIVSWNAGKLLAPAVASLPPTMGPYTFEAIVVDNASTDGSALGLPGAPWLRVVHLPVNVGFAAGTNRAAEEARGRYLLLLNPDTACTPGAIAELVRLADATPNLAAVGPRLRHGDGRLQRSCWRGFPGLLAAAVDAFYLWKLPSLPVVRHSEVALAEVHAPIPVDHLLGACMLIPNAVWRAVGPLDAGYFLFSEETDWCRRARRAGLTILYDPAAEVVHYGEHSVNQVPETSRSQYYRSYVRFVRQSPAARPTIWALKLIMAAGTVVRLGLWTVRRGGSSRRLADGMLRGYARVLAEVAGY